MELKEGEVLEELYGDNRIIQNRDLYRFTSDSILLSRFAKAVKGDTVADFCSGCGIVGLHFFCLNPCISSMTLFEMQESLSDMAERTIEYNAFTRCEARCMRLQDIGSEYDGAFSLILCNPPYEKGGLPSPDPAADMCRREVTITLGEIIDAAAAKLKAGGRLDIVNRADRTPELMYLLKSRRLEPKKIQYVSGSRDAAPYLIMTEAVKGGREGAKILPTAVNSGVRSD